MAKKTVKKKTPAVEVYNVSVSQIDRSYKGIAEWRNALKAAESISNPRRKLLYDLYKEIILDTHLEGVIGKRKLKILNKTYKFHDKSGKDNEEINTLIEKQFFEDVLNDLLDARFWGHSLLWFEELNDENQKYTLIERANVRPEVGEVIKEIYDDSGVPYRELPTSNYIIEAGKPKDLGLLLKCAPYAIYKKGNLSDWALYNQMFGFPFREFTYDGHDPKVKKEIERIAQSTLTSPYAIMPSNASMKILESGSSSSSNALFKDLSTFSDKQMSKAVLHSTMTIDAEGGNYKGDVHHQSEKEVTKADEKYILRILNTQFIQILANFGYKVDGGRFIVDNEDGLSLKDRLAIDKDLNGIVEIEPEYFYDKYKIPVPATGAKLKSQKVKESKAEEKETKVEKSKSQKSKRKDLSDKRSFKLRLNDLIDRFFRGNPKYDLHALGDEISELYNLSSLELSDDEIEELIDVDGILEKALINVYSGVTPKGAIDPLLWKVTTDQLNKAVDGAFGAVKFGEANYDFINRLKYNNGVFSAFKNHKQSKLFQKQLSDGKGVKSFAQFKKDTKSILGDYNKKHLKTEYNTAVLSSRSAHNFKRYESKLHLYPNLEYLPSRSPHPRQAHRPFYHTILPYNHSWWDTHTPPLDWNCKCGHSNTDADISAVPDDGNIKVASGLDNNPAKTGQLFSDSHPHIAKTKKKDIKPILKQADKFLRKTSSTYAREWGKQNIIGREALKIKTDNVPGGVISLRKSDIKAITGKPHKLSHYRNLLIPDMEEVFKDAIYLESKADNPNHSHGHIVEWLYYEIEFQNETSYISVMKTLDDEYRIHAISDRYKKQ